MLLLLLTLVLIAEPLKTGDLVPSFTLKDQHDQSHGLEKGTRWLVVAFDKQTGGLARKWLKQNREGQLDQSGVVFILETSEVKDGVRNKMILPSLRKFKQAVLVANDREFRSLFPQKEGCLTALQLAEDGVILAIHFPNSSPEISRLVMP